MVGPLKKWAALLALALLAGCVPSAAPRGATAPDPQRTAKIAALQAQADLTLPGQEKMPAARQGEWRTYWREEDESPTRYAAGRPNIATAERRVLYLQPIGDFSAAQTAKHEIIRQGMEIYFNLPTVLLPPLTAAALPSSALTNGRADKPRSLRIGEFTDKFLRSRLPADGFGIMALSAFDLDKGAGITGLYGDTLLYGRAGAISWFRLQDDLSLMIKGATHESAHLFALRHCQQFRCNLNGRITLEEFRAAPLWLCPDCMTKLAYATGAAISTRYAKLADFCQRHGWEREAAFYRQATTATAGTPE